MSFSLKILFLSLFVFILGFQGCSSHDSSRRPSNLNFISEDLNESTLKVVNLLKQKELAIEVCSNEIKNSFEFLSDVSSQYFAQNHSYPEYGVLLERMWIIKQSLRRHVQNWSQQNRMTRHCAHHVKDIMRAIRYIEDHVALAYFKEKGEKITGLDEDSSPLFSKSFPWSMSDNEKFDFKRDLRTGDILLWRGNSSVSASIARMGDNKNNFSHLSIIYRDPITKRLFNIESLIETGLIWEDFTDKPLHPGSGRVVVFRNKNGSWAQQAGDFAYQMAKKTMGTKNHLFYDFAFDLENHETVFCSEIVYWAYHTASKGKLKIPQFLTFFNMKNKKFLENLGVKAEKGFQPGDIELEPSFDMVAEWRNFNFARSNQLKDAILSHMYQWMEDYDYQFKWTFKGKVLGKLLYGLRRFPGLGELVKERLPLNMAQETLSSVITMDQVVGTIYNDLFLELYGSDKSQVYSFREIEEQVEKYREKDLERFNAQIEANKSGESYPDSNFHHRFGPIVE